MYPSKSRSVFSAYQTPPGTQIKGAIESGACHPPKKRTTRKADIKIMFAYSPRKNKANPIEPYSTLYPATSSASASGRSKGARLVSAKHEM